MKHPFIKLMAAGIVCFVIAVYCFNGPVDGTSAAFAQVRQAVDRMPLVHRTLYTQRDSGQYRTENWYSFDTRTVISVFSKGGQCFKISSLNYETMEDYSYDPNTAVVTRRYRTDVSADSIPESPWALVEQYLEFYSDDEASIRHERQTQAGKPVDVYQFAVARDFRGERVEGQFVVNSKTQLPLVYKRRIWTRQGDLSMDQVIEFDFPEAGPTNVYDVGVPPSARLVFDEQSVDRVALKANLLRERNAYDLAFSSVQQEGGAYYLRDGQPLKLVDPSQVELRAKRDWIGNPISYVTSREGNTAPLESIQTEFSGPDYYVAYFWDGQLVTDGGPAFPEGASLSGALRRIVGLSTFEYEIPDTLKQLRIEGDWIIRKGAEKPQLLGALEAIIQQQTGRNIRFEQRFVERDVIVAGGTFQFQPLSGTYDDEWIHVYSDVMDEDERGGGGSGTLAEFIHRLGEIPLNQQVVDDTAGSEFISVNWGWHYSSYLRKLTNEDERQEKLEMLLDHLSQQTALQFIQERRPVSVWTVSEQPD